MDVPAQSRASQPGEDPPGARPAAVSQDEARDGSGAPPRSVRPARRRLLFVLLRCLILAATVGGIVVAYLFFVTAGTFDNWPTYNVNFDMQAEGFRSGHLHLSATPAPELIAAADPYSPDNSQYWARDLTLYKGQYYLYWGSLPALILAAVKIVFRIKRVVGDQFLLFSFDVLMLLSGVLLIDRVARRLFPRAPFALTIIGILVLAFANPTPYLLATAGVYQTAIVGGQAFVLTGLLLAFNAFWPTPGRGAPGAASAAARGHAWALALACRVSLGPAILALACLTWLATWRGDARQAWDTARRSTRSGSVGASRRSASDCCCCTTSCASAPGWEFGQRFQLNDPELSSTSRFRTC